MLIGIDASRANKPHKTGVEWYSWHLIEQWKKFDREDQFFLYTNNPLSGDLAKCPDNFQEKRLSWPIPRSWTIGRLSLEMKFGKEIPDLLFVPAHTLPLLNPRKSVVTVHDIGFEHIPEAYHWANKLYHKLSIQVIKRLATKIITVSNYTKDDLIKTYNIPAEKIAVVYNGYDTEKYVPNVNAKEIVKRELGIDSPYVLFVGRLELKKNIVRLVEAFGLFKKKYPDDPRKLVLVGSPGIDSGLAQAQALIAKYGIESEVIQPGWLDDEIMPALHSAADVFFFPSLFEGFGIPILESMGAGCPVICSNTTSLPEAAGEAALMFNPLKVEEMVARLEQVLLNPEVADSLREKGFRQAANFSWRKCAEETLAILKSL